MTVSVIVSTCDRAQHLRELLEALARQRDVDFEVVVVNGPSKDSTASVLDEWREAIKVVSYPHMKLGASRNKGIAASSGDILVFIDDDGRPGDDAWLKRYADAAAAPGAEYVGAWGGQVLHRDSEHPEFDRGEVSDYCFLKFTPDWPRPPQGRYWIKSVCGCNMAFRREALIAIGGFDESFSYYAEETDVCARLTANGWTVEHLPDNLVRHYPPRSGDPIASVDRPWHVISRSDSMYALRHGRNSLPVRVVKTLLFAPKKHYVPEIAAAWRNGTIPATIMGRCMFRVWVGVLRGLGLGLTLKPSLRSFANLKSEFKLFERRHEYR